MKNLNSQVKIVKINNKEYIEKTFNKKDEERYLKERDFYLFCNNNLIEHVPQLFHYDNTAHTLHIEKIEILPPVKRINFEPALIKLLKGLQELNCKDYPHYANEAVTSETDIIHHIEVRYKNIRRSTFNSNMTGVNHKEAESLLNKAASYENKTKTEAFALIPSPSDIGKHNLIKTRAGYFFIDFEYAGLDSFLKIIYDYVLHPKNFIKPEMHEKKINTLFKKLNLEKQFEKNTYALFAIWWILRLKQSLSNETIKDRKDKGILTNYNINRYISERKNNILFFHNLLSRNNLDA